MTFDQFQKKYKLSDNHVTANVNLYMRLVWNYALDEAINIVEASDEYSESLTNTINKEKVPYDVR